MRSARVLFAFVAAALSVGACAQLFGVEDANPIADPRDASTDASDASHDSKPVSRPPDGPDDPVVVTGTDNVLAFGIAGELPQRRYFLQSTVASGKMSGWTAGTETPSVDPSIVVDVGDGLGSIIWGRWAGGVTKGAFLTAPATRTLPANGGLHYALGRIPRVSTPGGGLVQFPFLGGTHVTHENGQIKGGSVTGNAGVDFKGDATRVGFDLTLATATGNVTVSTPGGAADLSKPAIGIERGYLLRELPHTVQNAGISADGGTDCQLSGGCFATISGFLAGDAFDRLAIVVEVRTPNGDGDGGSDGIYTAVAVFQR